GSDSLPLFFVPTLKDVPVVINVVVVLLGTASTSLDFCIELRTLGLNFIYKKLLMPLKLLDSFTRIVKFRLFSLTVRVNLLTHATHVLESCSNVPLVTEVLFDNFPRAELLTLVVLWLDMVFSHLTFS